ncbi:hypothetical protein ElyMa_004616800 [Elysia marginata]|uniref:MADF domain-containing protein n=1 Tax=Elysia marginata TaxID=1093978 RepID=A0AAV4HYW9_9GAST|nr:hypothetical protein ElyMa_004616800 [Elysia marginata]
MTTWSQQNVLKFIELYQSHESLWKVKGKDYCNRLKKEIAYQSLLDFVKTFHPEADKDDVLKKINNLRGCFRKELKKIEWSRHQGLKDPEEYTPKLWYFPNLLFLKDQEFPGFMSSTVCSSCSGVIDRNRENPVPVAEESQDVEIVPSAEPSSEPVTADRLVNDEQDVIEVKPPPILEPDIKKEPRSSPVQESRLEAISAEPSSRNGIRAQPLLESTLESRQEPGLESRFTKQSSEPSSEPRPASTPEQRADHSRLQRGNKAAKRKAVDDDELLEFARESLDLISSRPEDQFDTYGRTLAHKLRSLPHQQRLLAEKLCNDVLFQAELGNLTIEASFSFKKT